MLNKNLTSLLQPQLIMLALLMAATRFHHSGTSMLLPDASTAIFFMAGLWNGRRVGFLLLFVEALLIDYVAIAQMGVSDFCLSPGYVFLLPTYAVLWLGGQYCRRFADLHAASLFRQLTVFMGVISVAFLISNGSFFLLSDKIGTVNWSEYVAGIRRYYPDYVLFALMYVGIMTAGRALWMVCKTSFAHGKSPTA